MTKSLLAFDTNRIKEYVFGTDKLKEIRGSSARLDQLNRQLMSRLVWRHDPNRQEIYAHGGAGLFVVESNQVDLARRSVEKAYLNHTGGAASVTGTSVPLPAGFDRNNGNARHLIRLLQFQMRQSKDQPTSERAITTLPHFRHCGSCAEFAATIQNNTETICQACQLRRQTKRGLGERLVSQCGLSGTFHQDLSELAGSDGYIGLVYADGNNMGQALEQQNTLGEIQTFARTVDDAIHHSTCEAILQHLQPTNNKFPFVPLLLGGDDLVIVTRARSAIAATITLLKTFEDYTGQHLNQRLSLSAGVVLAHAKFPFRTMLNIAESALKFAKHEAVNRQLTDRSLINFLVITSANHLDFKGYYSEMLKSQPQPQGPTWIRTLRPYTPEDLQHLVSVAHALKDAPKGRLQVLGESVFLSEGRSIIEGLTMLNRWGNDKQVKQLTDLVRKPGLGRYFFPWNGDANEWRTPILDLVELFDFIK